MTTILPFFATVLFLIGVPMVVRGWNRGPSWLYLSGYVFCVTGGTVLLVFIIPIVAPWPNN